MKWILFGSLLLNVILAGLYAFKNPVAPEAIVIEKVKPQIVEKIVYQEKSKTPVPRKSEKISEERSLPVDDFELQVQKMRDDREEIYLRLGISSQDASLINEIKEKYNQKYLEVIPADQGPDLTFEQRRRLLDLDEAREREFEKVFGEKRWQTFRRSQQDYNKKQMDDLHSSDKAFVPLEI